MSYLFEVLKGLDERDIPYVSWKNNHELAEVVSRGSDLDIFIPLQYRSEFESYIKSRNAIRTIPYAKKHIYVEHYYFFDEKAGLQHLHVYYKVVTGESWLKEFVLPLDIFLISERVKNNEYGIWVLGSIAQAYMFVIRHMLKNASILSRLLYIKEFSSYKEEWERCKVDVAKLKDYGPLNINKFLVRSGLEGGKCRRPSFRISRSFRRYLSPFLRLHRRLLWLYRLNYLAQHLLRKILGKKKTLPEYGIVLAISGIDGSGKSTMVNTLSSFYGSFLDTSEVALGKPQKAWLDALVRLRNRGRADKPVTDSKVKRRKISLPRAISAYILARMRLKMARKAVALAQQGYVVISDRWPTAMVGKMDGPKLEVLERNNRIVNILAQMENRLYSLMPRADVCIDLDVSVDELIRRNQERIKAGKETDEEIIQRHLVNQSVDKLCTRSIKFENSGDYEQMKNKLIDLSWCEISRSH